MSGPDASGATETVRAMLCMDLSGPDGMAMGEIASTPPAEGEVRIAMRACGINFPDLLMSRGGYQFKPQLPFSLGIEVAGEVLEVGRGVTAFAPGDRVIARTGPQYPGLAQKITLPADLLLPIPKGMDDETAAAFFVTYHTAWNALMDRAGLEPGETVLVHGAAGGIGLAAVQIARAMGAKVIATVGSSTKARFLESEGVAAVIDYGVENIRDRVRDLTGGRGADVVLDPVGGAIFDASVRSLAPEGRLLVVGFTSGTVGTAPSNIILIKEISVIGVRAGEYALRHPDRMRAAFAQMVAWFVEGKIAPRVGASFPMAQAAEALNALESRSVIGKVVVTAE